MCFIEGVIDKPLVFIEAGKYHKEFVVLMVKTYHQFARRALVTHKVLLFNSAMKKALDMFEVGQWATIVGRIDYIRTPNKKTREMAIVGEQIHFMSNDVVVVTDRARKRVKNEEKIVETMKVQAELIAEEQGECSVIYIDDDWEDS